MSKNKKIFILFYGLSFLICFLVAGETQSLSTALIRSLFQGIPLAIISFLLFKGSLLLYNPAEIVDPDELTQIADELSKKQETKKKNK